MRLFAARKQQQNRDVIVRYPSLDLFYKLWTITLKQRDYGPKFYIHLDGSVWVSYNASEIRFKQIELIPHEGHQGIEVYDMRTHKLESSKGERVIEYAISNSNVTGCFTIPKPVFYVSNCGVLLRDAFLASLDLKVNLVRASHEF